MFWLVVVIDESCADSMSSRREVALKGSSARLFPGLGELDGIWSVLSDL